MTSDTRQQLYDRIRESSLDEVILEEMIRHGFWPRDNDKPSLPAELIKRKGELQREIADLAKAARAYDDADQAVREIMKERMKLARERRIETKRRQAQQRYDKATAWYERRRDDIVHLGDTGSHALAGRTNNVERLTENGLPQFSGMKDVADAMGIAVGELRFLTYDRKVGRVSHYKRFQIRKKTGGMRTISAPMPRLKRAQYWLLENILLKLTPHDAAHGFRSGRSIMTNAASHINKAVVINLDLKDFFPSIGYRRVKGLFASFGYCEALAAVFALIATEADRDELELDGQTWHVATAERALPQGAPTSPAVTNLLCRKLDRRLTGAANMYGFTYTRYADDLTFSADVFDKPALGRLMKTIRYIVRDEGLIINEDKTRIMRQGRRQEVTGLTVNDGLGVSRKERRKFRAYLHNARNTAAPKSWRQGSPAASALGYANFLTMVHGGGVRDLVDKTHAIFGSKAQPPQKTAGAVRGSSLRRAAADGRAPRENWWAPAAIEPPAMPVELFEQTASSSPSGAQTSVPSTGCPQPQRQPDDEVPVPQARPSWLARARRWRIPLTVLLLVMAMISTGGKFLAGLGLYFLWFSKRR